MKFASAVCFTLAFTGLGACTRAPPCSSNDEFQASLAAWKRLVAEHGPTYYLIYEDNPNSYAFAGECIERVVVQVTDGVVTSRSYTGTTEGSFAREECNQPWIERGDELGSHTAKLAAWTMEQHYALCCAEVLARAPERSEIWFATFDDGVMRTCAQHLLGCEDGCTQAGGEYPNGIFIDEVGFGEAPQPAASTPG